MHYIKLHAHINITMVGVVKNIQKSFKYYEKAADLGNKDALYAVMTTLI